MSRRNVIVVATANDCPACTNFKLHTWPQIRDKLGESPILELWHLNKTERSGQLPSDYPDDIQRFIGWYPTIMLFTADSWYGAKKNPEVKLVGKIYGGYFDENGNLGIEESINFTGAKIIEWAQKNAKTESIAAPQTRKNVKPKTPTENFSSTNHEYGILVESAASRRRYPFDERS